MPARPAALFFCRLKLPCDKERHLLGENMQHKGEFLVQQLLRALEQLLVGRVEFPAGGFERFAVQVQGADQKGKLPAVAAGEDLPVALAAQSVVFDPAE